MNTKTVLLIIPFALIIIIGIDSVFASQDILSPLKQSKLGIPVEEIQCRDSLVIIKKYDGSAGCVTPDTQTELIKRGWTDPQSKIKFDTSMTNPYFSKYQLVGIEGNEKITKQLICPYEYYLISGSIRPQNSLDVNYEMEKIRQDGQFGWKFKIENIDNRNGIMKIQIDCSKDISQYKYAPERFPNQIKL